MKNKSVNFEFLVNAVFFTKRKQIRRKLFLSKNLEIIKRNLIGKRENTEVGNAGALVLDLGGDAENGCDIILQRGRHDLVVEHLHREGGGGAARRTARERRLTPVVYGGRHGV